MEQKMKFIMNFLTEEKMNKWLYAIKKMTIISKEIY